ncbi:hypothetical protein D3C72_1758780 [compost metagenome]
MVAAHDVTGVFTADQPFTLQQLGHDVTVADLGPHKRDVQVLERQLQAQVTHQRTDHPALQLAMFLQVASNDEQQLVTVDDGARVVDHQHAIAVTVKGNAEIGMPDQYSGLQ